MINLPPRLLGKYRRGRTLELLWEEGLARASDIFAHVFGLAAGADEMNAPAWRHHYRLLAALERRGWAQATTHPILPPRTQLWTLTRAGLTELSRVIDISTWDLPIPRDPRSSAALAHHLKVLDVRAQLEARFRWIPRRILAVHMAQAQALKIPDAMLVIPLAKQYNYWGFRAHVSVEVELQWKGPEQRRCDVARMAWGLGRLYSRILLLAETSLLAAQCERSIRTAAGKSVDLEVRGKEHTVQVPDWLPQHVDILTIKEAHTWVPAGSHAGLPAGTFQDWWTPRSHWGKLEKRFGLNGRKL